MDMGNMNNEHNMDNTHMNMHNMDNMHLNMHNMDDMHMSFYSGVDAKILFSGWVTTNALQLFGSCMAIFFAGVLYEGLKYYREMLHARAIRFTGDPQIYFSRTECPTDGPCGGPVVVNYSMVSLEHMTQTALHMIQSTASYMLMLIFMTYNIWLCLALVLGLGLGYFFFGWRKNSVVDLTEHCQ